MTEGRILEGVSRRGSVNTEQHDDFSVAALEKVAPRNFILRGAIRFSNHPDPACAEAVPSLRMRAERVFVQPDSGRQ